MPAQVSVASHTDEKSTGRGRWAWAWRGREEVRGVGGRKRQQPGIRRANTAEAPLAAQQRPALTSSLLVLAAIIIIIIIMIGRERGWRLGDCYSLFSHTLPSQHAFRHRQLRAACLTAMSVRHVKSLLFGPKCLVLALLLPLLHLILPLRVVAAHATVYLGIVHVI